MEFTELVDEIVARVMSRMTEQASTAPSGKPKLLVLTPEHGTLCHEALEHEALLEYYDTECALLQEYHCSIDDYEAVLVYGLDVPSLCQLADGDCHTPFTQLAQKAMLSGKRLFVAQETVELFQFAATAPAAYYAMLLQKLSFLQQCGVTLCPHGQLAAAVLSEEIPTPEAPAAPCPPTPAAGREVLLEKRVISERDLRDAVGRDVRAVRVTKRAIVTELAKEYLQARNIALLREEAAGEQP
ncbi:hypothetical protein ACTQ33_12215 [Candidatus Avoscillospira sp. LCP25S3_F1]|uniref:hypothetical protein n=1 Tax=Candidatus Avoscillospira sp. LCP25S3_F1 TaxID=3438825 RepID=UPI003F8DABBB